MDFVPVLDVGWAYGVFVGGVRTLLVLMPLTVLGEAGVLRWLLPSGRPLRDAFLMNLVSGLVGLGGLVLVGPSFFTFGEFFTGRTGGDYYVAPATAQVPFLSSVMLVSWALSVAIEGLVLMVLVREHPVRRVWPASVAANLGSYAVILLILFLARWADVV